MIEGHDVDERHCPAVVIVEASYAVSVHHAKVQIINAVSNKNRSRVEVTWSLDWKYLMVRYVDMWMSAYLSRRKEEEGTSSMQATRGG